MVTINRRPRPPVSLRVFHIRALDSDFALCGEHIPGAQAAAYHPVSAPVCRRCLRSREWSLHLAEARIAQAYMLTDQGLAALADAEYGDAA